MTAETKNSREPAFIDMIIIGSTFQRNDDAGAGGVGGGLNRIMWECELFSRGLIMSTGHCKEFSKPIFQALVVTQKERLTLKMSALETLHGG